MNDLLDFSLIQLRETLSSGAAMTRDLVEESLERIVECQPALNAFTEVCERSVEAAPPAGPLCGIPLAVKDMFVDHDRIPTVGSRVGGHWLRGTATVVERLRRAGGVVVGYTNLHEWGVDCTSAVTATGPIHNPWDLSVIPGGSSGGSAAALAAGAVPGAVGSDTGGSIRIPAACCGIVGLKPTWGRVPLDGFVDAASPIDHVGPMARTVADTRVLFEVLADTRTEAVDVGSLRIGIPDSYFFEDLDPRVGGAVSEAIAMLKKLVAGVGEIALEGSEDSMTGVEYIFVPLTCESLLCDLKQRPGDFQPETRELLLTGARLSSRDYQKGESIRKRTVAAWDAALSEVDVIVTPTLTRPAPSIEECARTLPSGTSAPTIPYLAVNAPMDLAGVPALSLPCGWDGIGGTVSMTLSAARGQDAVVLALGEALEREMDHSLANRIAPRVA